MSKAKLDPEWEAEEIGDTPDGRDVYQGADGRQFTLRTFDKQGQMAGREFYEGPVKKKHAKEGK